MKKLKTSKFLNSSAIDGNKNGIERPNKDLKYLEEYLYLSFLERQKEMKETGR